MEELEKEVKTILQNIIMSSDKLKTRIQIIAVKQFYNIDFDSKIQEYKECIMHNCLNEAECSEWKLLSRIYDYWSNEMLTGSEDDNPYTWDGAFGECWEPAINFECIDQRMIETWLGLEINEIDTQFTHIQLNDDPLSLSVFIYPRSFAERNVIKLHYIFRYYPKSRR